MCPWDAASGAARASGASSGCAVSSPRSRRRSNQVGVTLIELMVSLTITALIMGVLSSAAILFLRHSNDNNNLYDDDNSVQLLTSVFTADAQSATNVITNDVSACGSSSTALVSFVWAEAGTTVKASWSIEAVDSRQSLVRRRCVNGTPVEKNEVAGVTGTPTVTCNPNCTAPASVTLAGTTTNGSTFGITGAARTTQ